MTNEVEVVVWVTRETEKALHVTDGIIEAWIPKSLVVQDDERRDGTRSIWIPAGIARQKGFF